MTIDYHPAPVDTSKTELPEELIEVSELLAKNVHENWAKNRLSQGWTYGPKRDDTKKHHPCLVPYEELPESEKDYDRDTALETLKVLVCLGYKFVK